MNTWILIVGVYIGCTLLTLFNKKARDKWGEVFTLFRDEFRDITYCENITDKLLLGIIFSLLTAILVPITLILLFFLNLSVCFGLTMSRQENNSTPINPEKGSSTKTDYLKNSQKIKFRLNLPFSPNEDEIIFVDSNSSSVFVHYINENRSKLGEDFQNEGYKFIFFPTLFYQLFTRCINSIQYDYPYLSPVDIHIKQDTTLGLFTSQLLTYTDNVDFLQAGLLHYKETEDDYHIFTYFHFTDTAEDDIESQFEAYISNLGKTDVRYSLIPPRVEPEELENNADFYFPVEGQIIIAEIKERIKQLKQLGISEMLIHSLFSFDTTARLSRITIDKDYKIFLPDYNNIEIILHPLPKTVYFFFLKHPEGVLFKHLSNHKEELLSIYKTITKREKLDDVEESINTIVDSTKNSINEKCSRIKEAFVQHFDERIAHNYIITGGRFEPKRIILNRDLIIWESET